MVGAVLLAAAVTAGCALPGVAPEDGAGRVFAGRSRGEVFERTLAAVRMEGLRVVGADAAGGRIVAVGSGFQRQGWAECPATVADDDRRRAGRYDLRLVRPLEQRLELEVAIRDAGGGGVEVALAPTFSREVQRFFGRQTATAYCRSTGVLERAILDAVARRPAA